MTKPVIGRYIIGVVMTIGQGMTARHDAVSAPTSRERRAGNSSKVPPKMKQTPAYTRKCWYYASITTALLIS